MKTDFQLVSLIIEVLNIKIEHHFPKPIHLKADHTVNVYVNVFVNVDPSLLHSHSHPHRGVY